jgi:hypothetical protein
MTNEEREAYNLVQEKSDLEATKSSQVMEPLEPITNENSMGAWQAERADKYPPIGDQLDALFHAGLFPEEMAAKLQAVKIAYPKGE